MSDETDAGGLAIRVAALSFEYPGTLALDRVSFSVAPGTATALVGPNGAGKSTLMRCLAALETPLTGSVAVAGVDVTLDPRRAHRQLGYLSDSFGLYDRLSVRQSLHFAARSRGVTPRDIKARMEPVAAALRLGDLLDRRCGALSRGQRQRAAIGGAIMHRPRVLLLDEPASGLDPEARHDLARLIRQLRDEGMTLLVSSHILAELDSYCTHMLMLRAGRMVEHRSLEADGGAVLLRLARAPERDLGELLADRVQSVEAQPGYRYILRLDGDDQARAELLSRLVNAGLAVAEFTPWRDDLHGRYLRSVAGATAS